jgi:hypothetical protein
LGSVKILKKYTNKKWTHCVFAVSFFYVKKIIHWLLWG